MGHRHGEEKVLMKRYVRVVAARVALALVCLWAAACAVNPVTGSPQLMLLSDQEEVRLGQQTDVQIVRQYGIYEDSELNAYVNDVCQMLVQVSHRPNLAYTSKVMDDPVVNAFAVPGGYIYMTRGILAHLNNEAEMVCILGHELGHITARHSAAQYSRAQLAGVGLGLGMILVPELRYLSDLAQFGVGMLFLKFSRDNERQADDLGVEYASKLGYDASQMADFFETLERQHPTSDRSGLPEWFSTHPSPVDRNQTVRLRAAEWQQDLSLRNPKVNRDGYLRKIDGMVYGEDPRQGYEESEVFYHPGLRFQFPVPSGWKLHNTHTQVQMVSTAKDAAIMFTMAAKGSPEEAARGFIQQNRANVVEQGSTRINGFPAFRVLSQVRSQKGDLGILSYFIQKEGKVYVFHGLTPANRYRGYASSFTATMEGFKEIRDSSKLRVDADRIRVKTASATGPMRQTLTALGVNEENLEKLAVMNGMRLDDQVRAGSLIKVVEKGK
jgi:predicted Zn-dependent protease